MTCEPLARTGLDAPVLMVLLAGAVFVMFGIWSLLRARKCRGVTTVALLVVLAVGVGLAVGALPASPAFATPADCSSRSPNETSQPGQTSEPGQPSQPVDATRTDTESATEPGVANSLTITQTSTMNHLAPGVDPVDITGRVVNNGPDDTFIAAITVEIISVTKQRGAHAGRCDVSDYVLLDTRMTLDHALAPYGGSTEFGGAAIGFNNKSTNQDACQGAHLKLLYRAVAR